MKRVGKLLGRYLYRRFRRYAVWPTWRLFFNSFVFLLAALFFLRSNNITALEKYRQVIKADENGGSVYEKLDDLQRFTFSHMNSDIGRPVQLVNTYNRDANEIFAKAQAELNASGASSDIYLTAQKECEARGIPITARAQCVADYVLANNPEVEKDKLEVQLPDKALYSFRFPSSKWTWDLAGISIFLSLIFFTGALIRMLLARHLRKRWAGWDSKYLED
jgi:hypothetical protein